jgi:GNAT superfamily N-acetyltransferase
VVDVHLLNRDDVRAALNELADLYAVVYAEPPYEEGPEQVARFREHLAGEVDWDGFTLVVATDDTTIVGAAYGWTMAAGTWWSRAEADPPPDLRDVPKFAVMEWIVHPHHRGQGLGADLMRTLLRHRTEPIATLASDPRSAARGIYTRAGWRQVGTSSLPWGLPMDILVLPLTPPG